MHLSSRLQVNIWLHVLVCVGDESLNPFARRKTRSTFADYVTTKKSTLDPSAVPMASDPTASNAAGPGSPSTLPLSLPPSSLSSDPSQPKDSKHDLFELHSHIDIDIDIDMPGTCGSWVQDMFSYCSSVDNLTLPLLASSSSSSTSPSSLSSNPKKAKAPSMMTAPTMSGLQRYKKEHGLF